MADEKGPDGVAALDPLLIRAVQEAGASGGGIYLLRPGEDVLWLAVMSSFLTEMITPWKRVSLTTPAPACDAVVGHELIWVNSQEELARRYPRVALTLPYRFALAAAPIADGDRVWGALVLLWPWTHPPRLSRRERTRITDACGHMAELLRRAEERGRPVEPGPEPHLLPEPRARLTGPLESAAAVDFAERLPEGACCLDVDGRIAYVSGRAAELLGRPRAELLGRLPWRALPWLDDPVYEDRYRAAVFSQQPVSFTAQRPPDVWLVFELFPDTRGMSVCITPTAVPERSAPTRRNGSTASPIRAGALYQLMHLAASLTEAVG
ncbi:MAG TPA: PAS domain-containing protein, partial [Thermomonospora sp.]|nr:PAS domain-containing protein [Thermomonospora sp.]